MDFDDELEQEPDGVGSDELLSDDNLRLPAGANPLVRLHAVRAWLDRRERETKIEMGEAALSLQQLQEHLGIGNVRRREYQDLSAQMQRYQHLFTQGQERLDAYEEAADLLEDAVNHVTVSERLLVEYYLELDGVVQEYRQSLDDEDTAPQTPRLQALLDVQQRVERVGATYEEE
jgi:hypothetical protein